MGTPPLAYLSRWRLHLASTLLRNGPLTVSAVAERVGYDSEAAFSKAFKRRLGVPPSAYRRHPEDGHPSEGRRAAPARE